MGIVSFQQNLIYGHRNLNVTNFMCHKIHSFDLHHLHPNKKLCPQANLQGKGRLFGETRLWLTLSIYLCKFVFLCLIYKEGLIQALVQDDQKPYFHAFKASALINLKCFSSAGSYAKQLRLNISLEKLTWVRITIPI